MASVNNAREKDLRAEGVASTLLSLNETCLMEICKRLDAPSLANMQLVSKYALRLASEDDPWREAYKRYYPLKFDRMNHQNNKNQCKSSWMSLYRRRAQCEHRWRTATGMVPVTIQAMNAAIFGITYLLDPFPENLILLGGINEDAKCPILSLWNMNSHLHQFNNTTPNQHQLAPLAASFFSQRDDNSLGVEQPIVPPSVQCIHRIVDGAIPPFSDGIFNTRQRPGSNEIAVTTFKSASSIIRLRKHASLHRDFSEYTFDHLYDLVGHTNGCAGLISHSKYIITASFDGTLKLFSPPEQRNSDDEWIGPPQRVTAACTYADDVAHDPGTIHMRSTPREYGGERHDEHLSPVCCVATDQSFKTMISGGNDMILKAWDLETGKITLRLTGHEGWIWNVKPIDPELDAVVSSCTDGCVRVWDIRQGRMRYGVNLSARYQNEVYPVSGVEVSQDGRYIIASCFDSHVYVIDARMQRVMYPLSGHHDRISRLLVEGDLVLASGFDGSVRAWSFN